MGDLTLAQVNEKLKQFATSRGYLDSSIGHLVVKDVCKDGKIYGWVSAFLYRQWPEKNSLVQWDICFISSNSLNEYNVSVLKFSLFAILRMRSIKIGFNWKQLFKKKVLKGGPNCWFEKGWL